MPGFQKLETHKLGDFMLMLKLGKYTIPSFQRDYVWSTDKIVNLLNSIKQEYPIGLFTSATTSSTMFIGKNEILDEVIKLGDKEYKPSADIIIDGQQRMTSLAIVYFLRDINFMNIDDETSRRKVKGVWNNVHFYDGIFYISKDLKTKLTFKIEDNKQIKEILINSKISNKDVHTMVIDTIKGYKLTFSVLKEWTSNKVIEIFGAINSGAKPLTYVDLASSFIFSKNNSFELLSKVKIFNKGLKDYGKIPTETYLQLMKVYSDISFANIKGKISYLKKDILGFVANTDAIDFVTGSIDSFNKLLTDTFDYLQVAYGFTTFNSIPNNAFIFSTFYALSSDAEYNLKPKQNCIKKYLAHILSRSIAGDYASGTQQKIMDDLKMFQRYYHLNDAVEFQTVDLRDLRLEFSKLSYKKSSAALYKVAIAAMATNGPKNLFGMGAVKISPSLFSGKDTDQHHFVPKRSKDVDELEYSEDTINSIKNIVIISADENRNKIKNKNFKIYMKLARSTSPSEFASKMSSHFLDTELVNKIIDASSDASLKEDLENLWIKRAEQIVLAIRNKYS